MMQYIFDHSNLPVPEIFDYDIDRHNPVNFPFIIMEGLRGRPLGIHYDAIPQQHWETFFDQLAGILVELGTLSFGSIGAVKYDRATQLTEIVPLHGRTSV